MTTSNMPRYLNARQAGTLRDAIASAVSKVRDELIADGSDPRGLDHEIGIMLARAACRFAMDPLEIAATTTIGRLEVLVSELGARLELARIASDGVHSNGHAAPPACQCPPDHDGVVHWVGCPFAGCRREAAQPSE